MLLTYTSHLHTAIQCVLDTGETLGSLEGPCVDYCKCDGTSDVYAAIREQELDVIDPLDTEVVAPTLEAEREAKAEKAKENVKSDTGDARRDHRRDTRSDHRKSKSHHE